MQINKGRKEGRKEEGRKMKGRREGRRKEAERKEGTRFRVATRVTTSNTDCFVSLEICVRP